MPSTQIRLHFEFDARELQVQAKDPLDVEPTVIVLPFAVVKAAMYQILKAESEDELTVMQDAGKLTPAEEKSPIITPGG